LALALECAPEEAFGARDSQKARMLIGATLLNGGLNGDFDVIMT